MALLKGNQSDDLTLKYLIEQNKGGSSPVDVPKPSDSIPLADGTAAVGTSDKYAREDHIHPSDTAKQDTLVSGTNIKTVNSTSLLGSGNVAVQETLVSGTNIKTVNGNSLLGSGDVSLSDFLVVEQKDKDNITVAANSFLEDSFSIAKTGYTPIGVVGFALNNATSNGANSSRVFLFANKITTSTLYCSYRNTYSSAAKIRLIAMILYRKDS